MNIIEQIKSDSDLIALATAGKWTTLAVALPDNRLPDYRATGRDTLAALLTAGIDPDEVLAVVEANPTGRRLLGLLDAEGVNWADELTVMLLNKLVAEGGIKQSVADVLKAISYRATPTPTPEECERAWIVEACLQPIRDAHAAAAHKLNNATASLEDDLIKDLTAAELQARCDAITASDDGLVGA